MAYAYTKLPKPSWDERRIAHDFSEDLAAGDTIASISAITVMNYSDLTDITASAKKSGSDQVDTGSKSVSAIYMGGTPGQTYMMVAKIVTANAEKLSGTILMEIETVATGGQVTGDGQYASSMFDYGTAPPTGGTYPVGFIRWNSAPSPGSNIGWVCIVAGTPGMWSAFGSISE